MVSGATPHFSRSNLQLSISSSAPARVFKDIGEYTECDATRLSRGGSLYWLSSICLNRAVQLPYFSEHNRDQRRDDQLEIATIGNACSNVDATRL